MIPTDLISFRKLIDVVDEMLNCPLSLSIDTFWIKCFYLQQWFQGLRKPNGTVFKNFCHFWMSIQYTFISSISSGDIGCRWQVLHILMFNLGNITLLHKFFAKNINISAEMKIYIILVVTYVPNCSNFNATHF